MDPLQEHKLRVTRRYLLASGSRTVGAAALASLLNPDLLKGATTRKPQATAKGGLPDLPHFAPKAKRLIYLFFSGGPSHIDTFDYKPALREWHGTQIPEFTDAVSSCQSNLVPKPALRWRG